MGQLWYGISASWPCQLPSPPYSHVFSLNFAGIKAFEPGLLAKANRGILYVDEVNLLDDHLVDVLLDSAASGV